MKSAGGRGALVILGPFAAVLVVRGGGDGVGGVKVKGGRGVDERGLRDIGMMGRCVVSGERVRGVMRGRMSMLGCLVVDV